MTVSVLTGLIKTGVIKTGVKKDRCEERQMVFRGNYSGGCID